VAIEPAVGRLSVVMTPILLEGLLIAHADDEAVCYALSAADDVGLRLYEVELREARK
jgi:hypothetical protein